MRRLLQRPTPFGLLMYASTMAAALKPARTLGGGTGGGGRPSVAEMIGMFRSTARPATDALALVLARLTGDDVTAARIGREIAERGHRLPGWLSRLDEVRPVRAVRLGHVLGDGENIVVDVAVPAGALTLLVYVDHDMGTVVKDAFCIDDPFTAVVARLDQLGADDAAPGELVREELSLPDARAKLAEAVEWGRMTYPPFETETWPQTRPFVEWMLRLMPDGGTGYPADEVDETVIDAHVAALFGSPFGSGLSRRRGSDDRDIAETLFWLAAQQLGGDPLRWSPVTVEIVLLDLVPRKIIADDAYLRRVPEVVRRVIRFAHAQRGIPPHLTADTLAAVDTHELDYPQAVSRPRRQGPDALLERIGMLPPLDNEHDEVDDLSYFRNLLLDAVGGREAMERLDADPLPDEPFAADGMPADTRERVARIASIVGDAATALFGVEARTAAWRVLARIATADPGIFRRPSNDTMAAAAVLWITGNDNDLFSAARDRVSVTGLMSHLGLKGSPAQRAIPMLTALGVTDPHHWSTTRTLGDPALLVSTRRAQLTDRWHRLQTPRPD